MPRTSATFSGPGTPIYGEYLVTPLECNTAQVAKWLTLLYDSWPYIDYWQALSSVVLWNPSLQDAPAEFRRDPLPAGGLYQTGPHVLNLNINLMSLPILAHELGHHWATYYRIGDGQDVFGSTAFQWYTARSGGNVETFASDIGAFLLQEAKQPSPSPLLGLAQIMDFVRRFRTAA